MLTALLKRAEWTLVVAVLAGAAGIALRLSGLAWGLPARLHPDEWVIVDGALDLAARNSFEPTYFMRPDHLEIQLSYIAYQFHAHVVMGTGVQSAYAADPDAFLVISRLITALFGIAALPLVYAIGRQFSKTAGAVALTVFALFPTYVEHAHYATPDIPVTTMSLVTVLAMMRYVGQPRWASLLVAAAAVAASITIKYPGAIAATVIALGVIGVAIRDRRMRRGALHAASSVVAVVGFVFLLSPALFTNMSAVRDAFETESRTTHLGHDGLGFFGNLGYYAEQFSYTAGSLLCLAFLVGVVVIARGRSLAALPMALGLIVWVTLSALPLHWDRWALPMFTTPLLIGAIGIAGLIDHLASHPNRRLWAGAVLSVALVALLGNLLIGSIAEPMKLTAPTTRVAALPDFKQMGITPDNAYFEGYSPLLTDAPKSVFGEVELVDGALTPVRGELKDYLVLSSCMYDRYLGDDQYRVEGDFYAHVFASEKLVYETGPTFTPDGPSWMEPLNIRRNVADILELRDGALTGCTLRVFRLKQSR
jgi:hypothetical protein